jgi:hypothetical protein
VVFVFKFGTEDVDGDAVDLDEDGDVFDTDEGGDAVDGDAAEVCCLFCFLCNLALVALDLER